MAEDDAMEIDDEKHKQAEEERRQLRKVGLFCFVA
jgi:hypothetical protein